MIFIPHATATSMRQNPCFYHDKMGKTAGRCFSLNLTTNPRPLTYLQAIFRTLHSLRPGKKQLGFFSLSLLLCGVTSGFGAVSLGICPLTVCPSSVLLSCLIGTVAGYGLFWGFGASIGNYAILALTLCARVMFPKGKQRGITRIIYIIGSMIIGGLYVIAEGFRLQAIFHWSIQAFLASSGVFIFEQAAEGKNIARLGIELLLLLGIHRITLPGGSAAICVLAWLCAAPQELFSACVLSSGLSLLVPDTGAFCAVFIMAVCTSRMTRRCSPLLRCALECGIFLLAGYQSNNLYFSLYGSVGALLAIFLPPEKYLPAPAKEQKSISPVQKELSQAAQAMEQAAKMLKVAEEDQKIELAMILESVSRQVCRSCAKSNSCPAAAQILLEHCELLSFDQDVDMQSLPADFRTHCLHPEAFLTGINDALADSKARRRFTRRLKDARNACREQYTLIGSFLTHLSDRLYTPQSVENYSVELSVQATGRNGSTASGDRGAAFAGSGGRYYVLLCDGMGTGSAAAKESESASELLRLLLLSGMEPDHAMRCLNDIYLLRDNGCFSTIDLLCIDRTSGNATLYKWGAAPSILKRVGGARLLGGMTLPPGTGEESDMEILRFSMEYGSTLLLMSDGLNGKETRQRLEACKSLHPRDLTAAVFAGRQAPEDDCTAVAVRLRRTSNLPAPI